MKPLSSAIMVMIILHFLAASGFAMWMGFTGRISSDRIWRAVKIFELTIVEEEKLAAEHRHMAELEAKAQREAARLGAAEEGISTLRQRLSSQLLESDIANARLDRLRRETSDIRRCWENDKTLISKRKAELDIERRQFQDYVDKQTSATREAGFKQTVQMYDRLQPKQTKAIFQELMSDEKMDRVVAYLAAMSPRKSGAVLREFKSEQEVADVARLLERLQNRGLDPALQSQDVRRVGP